MSDIFIQSNAGGSWSLDIGKDGKENVITIYEGVQTLKESDYKAIKDDHGFATGVKKGRFVILNKKEVDKTDKEAEKLKEAKKKASKEVEALNDSHKLEIKKLKEKYNADTLNLSNLKKEVESDLSAEVKKNSKLKSELDELKKLLDEATK
jgi:hypothetical protein